MKKYRINENAIIDFFYHGAAISINEKIFFINEEGCIFLKYCMLNLEDDEEIFIIFKNFIRNLLDEEVLIDGRDNMGCSREQNWI